MHIVGDLLAESFTLGMRFLYTGDAVPQEIEECWNNCNQMESHLVFDKFPSG